MSWKNESRRHALASKGIRTGVKTKSAVMNKVPVKKNKLPFQNKDVENYVMKLKKAGFRVFVMEKDLGSNGKFATNWGFFEKDGKLGSFQYDDFRGFSFSTKHKANRTTGTGYQVSNEVYEPTIKNAEETFVTAPNWAKKSELSSIKKYAGANEYLNQSSFERDGYKEV